MTEEWRDILGYEGMYQISSIGRVKSVTRTYRSERYGTAIDVAVPGRILMPFLTAGYPSVKLSRDGRPTTHYCHRLVCEAWHGPRPDGCDVAHNDGEKSNNAPSNVRWATRQENAKDKVRHGTQPRGDDLWFTKISDAEVAAIRADEDSPSRVWAERLDVSASHVRNIRRGRERVRSEAA